MLIRHGYQDRVICGGAQETDITTMGTFDALAAFSVREDEPTAPPGLLTGTGTASYPSGGAATVIIESLHSAQKSGAANWVKIVGYGFSSNGGHISNPTVDGPVGSLMMSLIGQYEGGGHRLHQCPCHVHPARAMPVRRRRSMPFSGRINPPYPAPNP